MVEEGKYIYCIIRTNEERNFGPIGIGGRGDEVCTICYRDLSAVISNCSLNKYTLSRDNILAHEQVIEKVMQDYAVLPMRFCTVAVNVEEIRSLLRKRYTEFTNLLRDLDNKIELGLKAFWKNINTIFQETVEENKNIKSLKEKIAKRSVNETQVHRILRTDKIKIGKMVADALKAKRNKEREIIIDSLKGIAYDFRINETNGDEMLLNAAFLVDKGRELLFDNRMDELDKKYGDRIRFKYIGPSPPYNFVNITVK